MRKGLVRVLDWNEDSEQEILVQIVIPTLLSQVNGSLRDVDAADSKLLGGLAATGAALGTLTSSHSSLNHLWWIAAVELGVAAACFLAGIYPGKYELGPDVTILHKRFGGGPVLRAARETAADLDSSLRKNLNPRKIRLFRVGLLLLVVGLLGCIPLVLERSS